MKEQHAPCEWCGRQWQPGTKPCSMLDDRSLRQLSAADNVDETCKAELKKREG